MILRARTLSLVVLVVALAGCGGGSSSSTDTGAASTDDAAEVRAVVEAYTTAIVDRDGAKACRYLGREMREQFEQMARATKAKGCAAVMDQAIGGGDGDEPDNQINVIVVTAIKIDGDHATAQMQTPGGTSSPASLVKEGGVWKISPDLDDAPTP